MTDAKSSKPTTETETEAQPSIAEQIKVGSRVRWVRWLDDEGIPANGPRPSDLGTVYHVEGTLNAGDFSFDVNWDMDPMSLQPDYKVSGYNELDLDPEGAVKLLPEA